MRLYIASEQHGGGGWSPKRILNLSAYCLSQLGSVNALGSYRILQIVFSTFVSSYWAASDSPRLLNRSACVDSNCLALSAILLR
jgi:hypothetical protein